MGAVTIQDLDPAVALRHGRFDPIALLVLWACRKAFFPLLWIGLIILTLSGTDEATELQTAGDLAGGLLTPMAGIAAAILSRFAVAGAAFVVAYPLSRWNAPTDYAHGRRDGSRLRLWWDRLYLTRAYRNLRWTWAVRERAIAELGETGRRLALADAVLRWTSIGLFATFLAVAALTG